METAQTSGNKAGSEASRHSTRGFASMNSERQREIARKGGRAAHAKGTAHEFTTDEARAAGQKGGQRVSSNREHMSRIGRIGGKKSAGRRQPGGKGEDGNNSPDGNGSQGRMARQGEAAAESKNSD
jgi:general stress protein YciG